MKSLQDYRKRLAAAQALFARDHGCYRAYSALLDHADFSTWQAYPSYKRIAELAGVALGTVAKMIRLASEAGLLTVVRSRVWRWIDGVRRKVNGVNQYHLTLPAECVEAVGISALRQALLARQALILTLNKLSGRGDAKRVSSKAALTNGLVKSFSSVPLQQLELDIEREPLPSGLIVSEESRPLLGWWDEACDLGACALEFPSI